MNGKIRILIVDDEARNRELLRACIEDDRHELVEAATGERALELALTAPPDLVLLDVVMPGLDGYETARRLKAQAGDLFLPIILITSLDDPRSKLLGLDAGADEYLRKPIDRHELALRVRNLLSLRAKERELARQNLELLQLHRWKDEMAQMIVHDIKNPLAVMLSSFDFLADGKPGASTNTIEALHDGREAGRRAMRLLANLLDVARAESNRLELRRRTLDLGELLANLAHQRSVLAQAHDITLAISVPEKARVEADGDLVTRAIENLLDNAFRYTPRGGRIEIGAQSISESVHVVVGNTGPAIPIESRAMIFEKFAQARVAGKMNLGLGLYFCRLVAEAHGGKTWVEQRPHLPVAFVFELPGKTSASVLRS